MDFLSYVDEKKVGSKKEEEKFVSLHEIFTTLLSKQARLKLTKCTFGRRKVEILGRGVSLEILSPCAGNVKTIRHSVEPVPSDERMHFIRGMRYIARFVDHIARLVKPLYKVLKNTGFPNKPTPGMRLLLLDLEKQLCAHQKESWIILKETTRNLDRLAAFRTDVKENVMTCMSTYGLHGGLLEEHSEYWRPVSFTSLQLRKAEQAYALHGTKCLAMIHALKR